MYSRTRLLLGDGTDDLKSSRVAVFGCGGVGSYIIEALARAGVGEIAVIDGDSVAESNINRQLVADRTTVGQRKAEVARERILRINPDCRAVAYDMFYTAENADAIDLSHFDYVADAIDTVTSKLEIISRCRAAGVNIISSMGTGNKLDPTRFRISPIEETSVCPLARVMRRELKTRGITRSTGSLVGRAGACTADIRRRGSRPRKAQRSRKRFVRAVMRRTDHCGRDNPHPFQGTVISRSAVPILCFMQRLMRSRGKCGGAAVRRCSFSSKSAVKRCKVPQKVYDISRDAKVLRYRTRQARGETERIRSGSAHDAEVKGFSANA